MNRDQGYQPGGPISAGEPAIIGDLPRQRRRLNWGPFSVGATVTLIVAGLLYLATTVLGAHWYTYVVAVIGGGGVLLLGASAFGALVRRPRSEPLRLTGAS